MDNSPFCIKKTANLVIKLVVLIKYLLQEIFYMSYFTTSKIFLVPSFDLDEKEQKKIDRFLCFLENSGVGDIISKYINKSDKGGRPNCNYYRLFATILFGFAFDKYTLRGIESACKFDLRYISLMEQ